MVDTPNFKYLCHAQPNSALAPYNGMVIECSADHPPRALTPNGPVEVNLNAITIDDIRRKINEVANAARGNVLYPCPHHSELLEMIQKYATQSALASTISMATQVCNEREKAQRLAQRVDMLEEAIPTDVLDLTRQFLVSGIKDEKLLAMMFENYVTTYPRYVPEMDDDHYLTLEEVKTDGGIVAVQATIHNKHNRQVAQATHATFHSATMRALNQIGQGLPT